MCRAYCSKRRLQMSPWLILMIQSFSLKRPSRSALPPCSRRFTSKPWVLEIDGSSSKIKYNLDMSSSSFTHSNISNCKTVWKRWNALSPTSKTLMAIQKSRKESMGHGDRKEVLQGVNIIPWVNRGEQVEMNTQKIWWKLITAIKLGRVYKVSLACELCSALCRLLSSKVNFPNFKPG